MLMKAETVTPDAALAAYRKALETHKRADWRNACHMLATALTARSGGPATAPRREAPAPRPKSLLEFLAIRGLRDGGGDLAARDLDAWHKSKPFQRRLVRPDGLSLQAAADAAHEAGYFPWVAQPDMWSRDNMHPVTPQMLLDAIDDELRGRVVAPWEDCPDDYWNAMEPEEFEVA